ncbi:MAG: addiction module toxin, RelE/StbE [Bryobacterales bacterium]|nr:addiction module toxin, RelE/StbE [Bryobacterales bacterium]
MPCRGRKSRPSWAWRELCGPSHAGRRPAVAQAPARCPPARPAIELLADTPRPPGAKKLAGSTNDWRVRTGDYRIIYEIQDAQLIILVVALGHRRDIYRY